MFDLFELVLDDIDIGIVGFVYTVLFDQNNIGYNLLKSWRILLVVKMLSKETF